VNVVVVMPAYNAARTLERTYHDLPPALRRAVLLADDHSADDTFQLARSLGIEAIRNERNLGYGGNLKQLFGLALARGAEVIVELHPDYQYDPKLVDLMVEYIHRGYFDVMQGNRMWSRHESLGGGMPWYRYYGNRILTFFENIWFALSLGEWHSGLRAFRGEVLAALPLHRYRDSHVFASELLMDCVYRGYRVGEIPIPVRYAADSSSVDVGGLFAYAGRTLVAALVRPPWRRKPYGSARLPPLS
jgi:glycosyltransferase involved in cell wall biosynthesis